jgi:fructokinase
MRIFGGIEAGGTKFVCAVGDENGRILARGRIATRSPAETLPEVIRFFHSHAAAGALESAAVGSFGPVDLDTASPGFGRITSTPKPGWSGFDLRGALRCGLGVPVAFETDVNAAAFGEWRWGAARGLETFLYITVGTGLGGGGIANGRLMHGLVHPEMGHLRIPHDWRADPYKGCCPYHGDCLEGLAAGPALEGRWGARGEHLPQQHPAWRLEARYIALGVVNWVCTLSPQRVILGGGVMSQQGLIEMVRDEVLGLLNGYIRAEAILERIGDYIVPPALGGDAGVLGALALASSCRANSV